MSPYVTPEIARGNGAAAMLADLEGPVLVLTMQIPWKLFQEDHGWTPDHLHYVEDMDLETVEALDRLPACATVVGLGGGSCCDSAKYLAWKRGCKMVLVPTIVSVDAPLTNTVAVRVDKQVQYIGDRYPESLIVDYHLIQKAPKELNRAGACDIASIHTALHDWRLAHADTGERYDEAIAEQAARCLATLDQNAAEVYDVTPKGIDTIIDLYQEEVEFCAVFGNSRPEEGSEHIVAYNLEHLTRRHFLHGDLVGLGIVAMSRLQGNDPAYALDLVGRCGLRYAVEDATVAEISECLRTLQAFKEKAGLFYSVVDTTPVTDEFVDAVLKDLGRS